MRFKNKVVIVTGSSRGIGKATAIAFAKEGAKVVVNYNNSEKDAKVVVNEIKKIGSEALLVKCDVADEKQVKQMIDKTIKTFGSLDILVNNAGIVIDVPYKERTVEHWKKTIDVNLIGMFACSKYASQKMKNGCIVNISSTNAMNAYNPDSIDYGASKAGVILLTKSLAMEFGSKIRVNCVAPGWVDTDMNKDLPEEFVKTEMKKIFMKRWAKPDEIAKTILFLASEDASYITGSIVVVDGGYQ